MSRHVVFGTGQVGRYVVEHLVAAGEEVVAVNRSGAGDFGPARVVGGDMTDPRFAADVAAGAGTVYFCLNAPSYDRWPTEFPPLQRAVVAAATAAGARLVVLENLYAYGDPHGTLLSESTPFAPENAKGATRAAMTAELLDAHARGDLEVTIGRAADLVGPGVRASALGEQVFARALAGRAVPTMGRPDTLHSFSYAPDVGRNLVLLGSRPDAYGRAWHLPNPPTRTTRAVVAAVGDAIGRPVRLVAAPRQVLWVLGRFDGDTRELLHTYYQFARPFVVDDTAFRAAFGGTVTDWPEILERTIADFRAQAR